MHIVVNQSSNVFGIDAENKIFAQSAETITFDVTFNDPQATLQGLYCALLSDSGKTLALTTISGNIAVLDTNTIECVEYVAQWAIGTTRHAYLVIGESTKPLAIIDVEVAQNPLEGLMPPTESAPTYPTSAELQAILKQINAQAQSARESAQSANQSANFVNTAKDEVVRIGAQVTTDKALIAGYASSASSSAGRAEEAKRIAVNASESVSEAQDEINATKTKIDATAKTVQTNATAVADAKNVIDGKVEIAETSAASAMMDAESAKGFASEASTSASNASKSAQQAEQAKTAIGDVGARLGAVETSVAEKVPYISPLLRCMFDLVQAKVDYRVTNVYFCHEGFLFRLFARSYVTEFLRPKDNNWSKVDLGVIKLIAIYSAEPKTVIYSVNGTKNLKSVVSGQGASLAIATEEIATLPANVSAYSDVYAYEESHGFFVTTNGLILNSDLTESGTTFATTSGKGLLKVGDVFKYFDTSAKAFIQMTVGADGVPSFTKNGYTQDANQTYIPTKTMWGYCRFTQNRLTGCSDWNNGYIYKQITEDGFLQCVISDPLELSPNRNNGYVFVTDGDRILRIVGTGNNTSYPTFSCEAIGLRGAMMDYNRPIGGVFTSYSTIGAFRDFKGNTFIAEGESFSKSSRTFYTLLVAKEA